MHEIFFFSFFKLKDVYVQSTPLSSVTMQNMCSIHFCSYGMQVILVNSVYDMHEW